MAGRFAHALRTGQRGVSPRRARAMGVLALATLAAALFALATQRRMLPAAHVDHTLAADENKHVHIVERAANPPPAAQALAHAPVAAQAAGEATARIITCPACRLNALPSVKAFVYDHAKTFAPALKVDFQFGEDPRMLLFVGAKQVEVIDLAEYDTPKIMKRLYAHGVRPTAVTPAVESALGSSPLLQTVPDKAVAEKPT